MKLLMKAFVIGLALLSFATCTIQSGPIEQHLGGCVSCNECQRVVYQYKFHGMPDCEDAPACRDTVSNCNLNFLKCAKIKEMWNTPWSPFEPFTKDIFGKCEICFRAGFCKISECKDQERRELEIINSVVNAAHLTAKVGPEFMVDVPKGIFDDKAVGKIQSLNAKVEKKLTNDLKKALKTGSIREVAPEFQILEANYFDQPDAPLVGSVTEALSLRIDPLSKPTPSMYTLSPISETVQMHAVKAVDSLGKTVSALKSVMPENKKMDKTQSKTVDELKKKAEKTISSLEKKLNTQEKKVLKDELKLDNLLKTVDIPQKKEIILKSKKEIDEVERAITGAKKELKKAMDDIKQIQNKVEKEIKFGSIK